MKRLNVVLLVTVAVFISVISVARTCHAQSIEEANRLNAKVIELYRQGRYNQAIPLAKRYLRIVQSNYGENHANTATAYNNLATLYKAMSRYGEAEELYKKALEIREKVLGEDHPSTAASYDNLAGLCRETGRYGEAEPLYKKALKIYNKVLGEKHTYTAECYNSVGFLYLAMGKVSKAEGMFRKTGAEEGLALCDLKRGNYAKALSKFKGNLEYVRSIGSREDIVADLIAIGLCYEGLGQYNKAKDTLYEAIIVMEEQRGKLKGGRASFIGGKTKLGLSRIDAYEALIRVLIKEKAPGYEARSLEVCERVKGRMFLEMLAMRHVRGRSPEEGVLLEKDRIYMTQIGLLQSEIETMRKKKIEGKHLEKAQKALKKTLEEYQRFQESVKDKRIGSLITVQVPELSRIQRKLDNKTRVVEYFTGKDATYIWVISRDGVRVKQVGKGKEELTRIAMNLDYGVGISRSLRNKINVAFSVEEEKREPSRGVMSEAYRELIAPIEGDIRDARDLIIVPYGALHRVPFAAIRDGKGYLSDRWNISFIPSLSTFMYIGGQGGKSRSVLGMANSVPDTDPLEFAEPEVRDISRYFRKRKVYVGKYAREKIFKGEAPGYDVIHLAVHGLFSDLQPLDSGLVLRGGGGEDGILRISEVFGIDLTGAELVVLSACESGLGVVRPGDEMVALSRAFLYAGTPSLIASLWKVDDRATKLFMDAFYENWKGKGMSKAEALSIAQRKLRSTPGYESPAYWAAFELIGDRI